jgi:hypothetical protein
MSTRFRMRALLVAGFAALAMGSVAIAQDTASEQPALEISPDHLALARKYVDMTDTAKVYEDAVVRTAVQATRTLVAQSPDLSDQVATAAVAVMQDYQNRKDELFDQFARIYAIHFTPDELNAIIAFYQTDVGQRLLSQLTDINQELQLALQVYETNLSNEFMAKLKENLAAEGYEF